MEKNLRVSHTFGILRTVERNERIHDVNHRDHGIGWWMDGSKNYI